MNQKVRAATKATEHRFRIIIGLPKSPLSGTKNLLNIATF